MKKKLWIILAIVIIILTAIFIIYKIKDSKINYEIEQVEQYLYFKYYDNEKMGIIDHNGNIIIDAQYDNIVIPNPEKDVFICYVDNEPNQVLNSNGEEIFSEYDNIEPIKLKNIVSILCYEKNSLIYEKDGKYGLIDFEGKEITKNIYDTIENLQSTEGKFLVSQNGKYGVININGVNLVDVEYDRVLSDEYYEDVNYAKSGFIISNTTKDGYRYGYINYKGKKILDVEYNEIIRIDNSEEELLIVSQNGQYGLYKNNKEIVEPQYQSIIYEDGILIIQKNQNYGVMNLEGEIIIDTKYSSIEKNGIYLYARNSEESAVYDISGNKTDISFNKTVYDVENTDYRIVTVLNNEKIYYGIENKEGTSLVNTSYSYIEYLFKDYFIAKNDDGKLGVINANGREIINLEYELVQKIKDKNILQILGTDSNETQLYSSDLINVCTMEGATIENETNYIRIYNEDEERFFDINGNELEKDSDQLKDLLIREIPANIGEYEKVQYSLDDVYYVKE